MLLLLVFTKEYMMPKYKSAAIVLTNASDGPAVGLTGVMMKVIGGALYKAANAKPSAEPIPDLSRYEGNFGGTHWGGELAIRQWGDKLSIIKIPSDSLDEIPKLKRVSGDTFVRLTEQGEEREQWVFQTNKNGKVIGVKWHCNITSKLLPESVALATMVANDLIH